MRYLHERPVMFIPMGYGQHYECDHPVYNKGTLYLINDRGLVVIQQRFDPNTKSTSWGPVESWLSDEIYVHPKFQDFFNSRAQTKNSKGLYPTVTVRQIMWALRMKPLKKERWETVFDRKVI